MPEAVIHAFSREVKYLDDLYNTKLAEICKLMIECKLDEVQLEMAELDRISRGLTYIKACLHSEYRESVSLH